MSLFTGAWVSVKIWLRRVVTGSLGEVVGKQIQLLGETVLSKVRAHIVARDLGWAPLAPSTIARKAHDRPYIETMEYYRNVVLEVEVTRLSTRVRIGPTKAKGRKGVPIAVVAKWLEYGVMAGKRKIPARPLWRPSFDELKATADWAGVMRTLTRDF